MQKFRNVFLAAITLATITAATPAWQPSSLWAQQSPSTQPPNTNGFSLPPTTAPANPNVANPSAANPSAASALLTANDLRVAPPQAEASRNSQFVTPPPAQLNTDASLPVDPNVEPSAFVSQSELPIDAEATITQAQIDEQLKRVNEAADLDEAQKAEALARLKSAATWLKTAEEATVKAAEYTAEIQQAPTELAAAKEKLAKPHGEPQFPIDPTASLPQFEQFVNDVDVRLKTAREQLVKHEETIKQRLDRKTELTRLLAETNEKLEKAQKAAKAKTPVDTTSLGAVARAMEDRAHLMARKRQRALYTIETQRIDAVAELIPLRRDLAKREVAFLEKLATGWHKQLDAVRKRESDRQAAEAKRRVEKAQDPALRMLAQNNATVAERRQALLKQIQEAKKEIQESQKLLDELKGDYTDLVSRVDIVGHSTTIGVLLRRQRNALPDVRHCRERIRFVQDTMPKIHLALIDAQDRREGLGDLEAVSNHVVAELEGDAKRNPQAVEMVQELLTSQRDLLDQSILNYDEYVTLLAVLEVTQQNVINQTDEFATYIDERVLWIRSSDPIGIADLSNSWAACLDLANLARWQELGQAVLARTIRQPAFAILAATTILLMLAGRRRLRLQLQRLVDTEPERLASRFLPTLEAVASAALATAFWPGLMWLLGWQLVAAGTLPELGRAIGVGLQSTAFIFWICQFTRQMCKRNGICRRHFDWNERSLIVLRRHATGLAILGVPMIFIVATIASFEEGHWAGSLGRLVFLAGCLAFALWAGSCLNAHRGIFSEDCGWKADAWFYRLRYPLYWFGVATPVALGALSILGYDYSAQRLAMRLQATLSALLAIAVLHAIALRWLAVRRSALVAQAKLTAELANESKHASDDLPLGNSTGSTPAVHGEHVPVEAASFDEATDGQVRYLLRFSGTMLFLTMSYFVWSDVAPALSVLDKVEVWSKNVEIVEEVEDPVTGKQIVQKRTEKVATTYKQLAYSILTLVLGFALARNLPALLQVLVLERMPIDTGQRYAAGLIFGYAVTLAAIVIACQSIGLSWKSIQWLAAAMTVGLGFGLQEIFANLVSGVIILFERPIRVGDLVTVSGVSGRVTRMQMRATTVTDFDRRELIVPNKKFITEEVMNWTLSDDVNRIVIEVGVAYGSDTQLARDLLLQVVRRHPVVLNDPEPIATFDKFNDSSLNLTLRCFLPNLENRLATIHELHSQIDAEFRKANIEIAFPQQDLHVRSIEAPLLAGQSPGETKQQDAA